jgi:hypothetical protein
VPSRSFELQENSVLTTTTWLDVTNPPTLNLTNLQGGWGVGGVGSDLNRFFDFKDFAFSISMEIQLAFDFAPRFLAVRNGGVR